MIITILILTLVNTVFLAVNVFLLATVLAILMKAVVPATGQKLLKPTNPEVGLIDLPIERQPTYGDLTAQKPISSDIILLRDD